LATVLASWAGPARLDVGQPKVSLELATFGTGSPSRSPSGHKVFENLVLGVEGRRSPRKTSTTRRTFQVSWRLPGSPRDTGQVAPGFKDKPDGSDQRSLPGRSGRSLPAEKPPGFSPSGVSPLATDLAPITMPFGPYPTAGVFTAQPNDLPQHVRTASFPLREGPTATRSDLPGDGPRPPIDPRWST